MIHFNRFLSQHHCTPGKIFSAVVAELLHALDSGSSCLPLQDSALPLTDIVDALSCDAEGSVVGSAGKNQPLILTGGNLYLNRYFSYEHEIATQIRSRLLAQTSPPQDLEERLAAHFSDAPHNDQAEAARKALTQSFSIISGGPGTGKTTTVLKVLLLLRHYQFFQDPTDVLLLAPTGKAADRLRQSIMEGVRREGVDPAHIPSDTSTIHRALGFKPSSVNFKHDAQSPLSAKIVVVDETSMVDLPLMAKLMRAIPPSARIILLGDQHQLSSVEVGSVLADLIDRHTDTSSQIHQAVTILRKSYRNQGPIHTCCQAIKHGDPQAALDIINADPHGVLRLSPLTLPVKEHLAPFVRDHWLPVLTDRSLTVEERLKRIDDFRILTPTHNGSSGIDAVNYAVDTLLTDAGISTSHQWYEGRSVIIQENDHNLGIYNGDTGLCVLDPEGQRKVAFSSEDGVRLISPTLLPSVKTAWALTIHRTQGSEYGNILLILPATDDSNTLVTRELLYTGLSRTKGHATIWSTPDLIQSTINTQANRASGLSAQIGK